MHHETDFGGFDEAAPVAAASRSPQQYDDDGDADSIYEDPQLAKGGQKSDDDDEDEGEFDDEYEDVDKPTSSRGPPPPLPPEDSDAQYVGPCLPILQGSSCDFV